MTRRGYREPIIDRLDRWTDKSGGPDACWPWTGGRTKGGYGIIAIEGRTKTAHRALYEAMYGPLPPSIYACHRCDYPACMNPMHLFRGPPKANVQDMVEKGRARGGAKNPRKGEQINFAKLTEVQVEEMRQLRAEGFMYRELAERFGVAYSTVERVCRGVDWRHLPQIDPKRAQEASRERRRRASQHNNSRLTPNGVREIRANPESPLRTLAERLGVSAQAVANVRNRKTWTEIQ